MGTVSCASIASGYDCLVYPQMDANRREETGQVSGEFGGTSWSEGQPFLGEHRLADHRSIRVASNPFAAQPHIAACHYSIPTYSSVKCFFIPRCTRRTRQLLP